MDKQIRSYNIRIREMLDLITAEIPDHPIIGTIHRRFRVATTIELISSKRLDLSYGLIEMLSQKGAGMS